jgi:hypothetical protein
LQSNSIIKIRKNTQKNGSEEKWTLAILAVSSRAGSLIILG